MLKVCHEANAVTATVGIVARQLLEEGDLALPGLEHDFIVADDLDDILGVLGDGSGGSGSGGRLAEVAHAKDGRKDAAALIGKHLHGTEMQLPRRETQEAISTTNQGKNTE